jgi:hypothetical protein
VEPRAARLVCRGAHCQRGDRDVLDADPYSTHRSSSCTVNFTQTNNASGLFLVIHVTVASQGRCSLHGAATPL